MLKLLTALCLILISTSAFSNQISNSPDTVVIDTPCDTLVLVYSAELTDDMSIEEMITELNESVTLTPISKEKCGKNPKGKKSNRVSIQASTGPSFYIDDVEEPLPPNGDDGWVLIDTDHHTTTVQGSCHKLETTTRIWEKRDGNGNVITYGSTSSTVIITILGCDADSPVVPE